MNTMSNVRCCFETNDEILIKKDGVEKVVCLSDGRVLELLNETVVGTCLTPYFNTTEIVVFYSYDPFIKYYIIKEDTTLAVLKKLNGNLEIFRTYKNVQKYEIKDFLIVGRPQVKIWLMDEMEPLVTDFSGNNLCNLNDKSKVNVLPDLNRRLHMIQSSLAHLNKISEDRKQVQRSYFKTLSNDKDLLVLLNEPWQRILNNRWIICVCLRNNYLHPINNLQLISNSITKNIDTKVCNFMYSNAKQFYCRRELLPNSCAYVIGVTNEPDFVNLRNPIKLSCSLLYNVVTYNNTSVVNEFKLPSFVLSVEELITKNLGVFINEGDLLLDIITSTVINEMFLIEISLKDGGDYTKVVNILIEQLRFIKFEISNNKTMMCYVADIKSSSMLSGLIIFIDKLSVDSLVCYSKNVNQVKLLKCSLEFYLKDYIVNIHVKKIGSSHEEEFSIIGAVNALDEEFMHFSSVMRNAIPVASSLPLRNEDHLKFSVQTWKDLIESTLLLNTDVQLQGASKSSDNVL